MVGVSIEPLLDACGRAGIAGCRNLGCFIEFPSIVPKEAFQETLALVARDSFWKGPVWFLLFSLSSLYVSPALHLPQLLSRPPSQCRGFSGAGSCASRRYIQMERHWRWQARLSRESLRDGRSALRDQIERAVAKLERHPASANEFDLADAGRK
jgi:hypothetical protein